MEELRTKLIELGVKPESLYISKENEMFVDCADTQLVRKENGVYSFHMVGRSRYFYLETFTNVEECANFILKFYNKTCEQINEEYRKLAAQIGI